ncbi:MAG TPA: hypothetical protein VEB19_10755 [Gemmatimonadaceae bacterium]|nr:hypothetical protein [Gemmatimonadaceae bacterium]
MHRSLTIGGVLLAVTALAAFAFLRHREARDQAARHHWNAAIRATFDPSRDLGWIETFETTRTMPLAEYDPRWQPLFGRLLVDRRLSAVIGDPEGGWQLDGGDDYAFRALDVPVGSVEMTVDGWWDGHGSIGAQIAVQRTPPHQLYEAALWRGRIALIHFIGPTPDRYEVLAESVDSTPLAAGFYRLQVCAELNASVWRLRAVLRDPLSGYRIIRQVSASDGRLPEGFQGIGLLGSGGPRASYVTGIVVRSPQEPLWCSATATP